MGDPHLRANEDQLDWVIALLALIVVLLALILIVLVIGVRAVGH